MQKEVKYYTPELEEFHIGFEYEIHYDDGDHWGKQICEYGMTRYEYEHLSNHRPLRVKYLDEDDIKELSWKRDSGNKDFILDEYQLELIDDKVLISSEYGFDTLFWGTIKNKSELKKLMSQLGICTK